MCSEPDHGPTKVSLENWINGELYEAFPKISSGALNEMTELKKKLAMVIIDDKERIQEAKHDRSVVFLLSRKRDLSCPLVFLSTQPLSRLSLLCPPTPHQKKSGT